MSELKWPIPSVERGCACTRIPKCMTCCEQEIEREGNESYVGEINEIGIDSAGGGYSLNLWKKGRSVKQWDRPVRTMSTITVTRQ